MITAESLSKNEREQCLKFDSVIANKSGIFIHTAAEDISLLINNENGYKTIDKDSVFYKISETAIDIFLSQDRLAEELFSLGSLINNTLNKIQIQSLEIEIDKKIMIANFLEEQTLAQLKSSGILDIINSEDFMQELNFIRTCRAANKFPTIGEGKLQKLTILYSNYAFDLKDGYEDAMREILKIGDTLKKKIIDQERKKILIERLILITRSLKFSHIRKIISKEVSGEVILEKILSSEETSVDDIFTA